MTRRESETTDGAHMLIGAKLESPHPSARPVARPHLIEMLDRGFEGRITLISAPAGYGKTILVGQWLDLDSSRRAAWLSLDPLDNDLQRFVRYVVAALHRVEEGCLSETEELLSAPNLPPPQHLAESMVFGIEKLGQRVALVLDDYGSIRAQAVHELLSSLVPKLPPTLHLVVTSRIDPPLPLSLWRSRRWLRELRAVDLRFSRDETRAFFDTANELELSDEAIDTIHRKTEGWITGLRLALLSLAGAEDPENRVRAFSASDRLVSDYLMEEVLVRQSSEVREFLAVTSVLDRFSPQLCDELVTGSDRRSLGRSRELLERLFKENLFVVPLGPTHGWYRYHHLFRQLLLERFDELTSTSKRPEILRRAGNWFCDNGWTEDGLRCLVEAGDLDSAADVVGNHLHDVIADDLSRRTLARWLELFPSGAERTRLPLLVAAAYTKSRRTDHESVSHLLQQIDATCGDPTGDRQQRWQRVLQKDLAFLRAFASFWKGDVEGTFEHGSRVLDRSSDPRDLLVAFTSMYYGGSLALTGRWAEYRRFVEDGTTGPGSSDSPQQLPLLVVKAMVHLYRGELAPCREVASRLTTGKEVAIPKYFEAVGHFLLGVVAYERNQLDEAESHFLAVESRRFDGPGLAVHGAATGLAHVEMARGNIASAERHAAAARVFAIELGSSMLVQDSEAVERYLAVAAGKPLDPASAPPTDPDFMQMPILPPSHGWAQVQIQSPSFETRQAGLEFVDAALHLAETHGVRRRVIQLSALRALALDAQSRREEAISVLETALQRGAALGFVRSFIDCGEGVRPLLHAIAERNPGDKYVTVLLGAIGASPPQRTAHLGDTAAPGSATPMDGLTNRELDVLELLQRRLSNKEIASRLGISDATVKMHTLNLYGKLGVHGRRQAVTVAIKRGILAR